MEECEKALQGRMIKLMTQKILKDIKKIMLDNNEKNRMKVKKYIINEFIGNYKIVKSDKDFIGYIVDILKNNLLIFYERYKKNISNNTLNLLYTSDLINEVKKCIQVYKKELKEKINTIVEKKANDFICLQADIEKKNDNMHIENKRRLEEFKKTNRKYFKQNYYFICQKYIINQIIQNYIIEYFIEIKNKIDKIIKDLLTSNDEEIRFHLENCFLNKLKNFAEKVNIHHTIKRISTRIFEDYPLECEINKIEPINESRTLSDSDEQESFALKNEDLKIKDDIYNSLNEFFIKNIIQDTYFNQEMKDDQICNLLKKYIKSDLLNYVYLKKDFINNYNHKTVIFDKNPISKIIGSEQTSKIYKEKIKNEFKTIENNFDSFRIKYLSIIIIGRSGAGKSTLINCMLKEIVTDKGRNYITIENIPYQNKKIPFLRLIKARGIEIIREYGPKILLENVISYIQNQKSKENQDYNNYIHSIWYCVKGNYIDEEEIEIINYLRNEVSNLPLIVVNTFKIEKENKIKQKILEKCPNIKYIQLLAKSIYKGALSYGLDDLINITLEVCSDAIKGDIFNKMGEEISRAIENNFNNQNKIIQENIKKEIKPKFLNYNKYLRSDDYLKYILNYLEKIFLEFFKLDKEEKDFKLSLENQKEINNMKNIISNIKKYINFYESITKKLIECIRYDKTIEYLDFQVEIEKKEGRNIKRENKNNKENFEEIIVNFLNNNFRFIAQKHYLDCIEKDISEIFIKDIEEEITKKVKAILKNESRDLFIKIYKKKFEDFKNWINEFNDKKNKNNISL